MLFCKLHGVVRGDEWKVYPLEPKVRYLYNPDSVGGGEFYLRWEDDHVVYLYTNWAESNSDWDVSESRSTAP